MSNDFYINSILPYAGIIIKICRAYSNSQEDFEDYYQEVCLQVWRSKDQFKGNSKWSTWIYRIALNVCITIRKKENKRNKQAVEFSKAQNTVTAIDLEPLKDDSLNQLYAAIKQLSVLDRAIIILYLEEKSYKEIATIIGTNANNIGIRIKRIKTRLKNLILKTNNHG